jgi:hypothetical protein
MFDDPQSTAGFGNPLSDQRERMPIPGDRAGKNFSNTVRRYAQRTPLAGGSARLYSRTLQQGGVPTVILKPGQPP